MLSCQRHLFDIPDDIAYFNAAYMTPLPLASIEAGETGLNLKRQPWLLTPEDFFETSERGRAAFATLIGATAGDIAITPSASYGLAVAAANLAPAAGSRILVLEDQFPSHLFCWRRLARERECEVVTIATPPDRDLTRAVLEAIDERVSILALPHCRWTDGALLDLEAIGEAGRAAGAALVLDTTQSLGALPLDVGRIRPDFMAVAGYKWLFGPYSLAWLYAAPHRQSGLPLEESWITRANARDFARLVDYQEEFAPGAQRYDMGERANFALLPAGLHSLELLATWGIEAIAATLASKNAMIAGRLEALGLRGPRPELRAGHFLGLDLPEGTRPDLAAVLGRERIFVSVRGRSLRVTAHLYNHDEDVERLTDALRRLL